MSILIKGIEMPAEGWHKVIKIFSDGTVVSYYDSVELGKAIPIPPHGPLKDADALIIDLMDRGVEGLQTDDWHEIQQSILDAPTVIEAEKET